MADSITNGPLADSVKDQASKTSAEFSNLKSARQTPATPAATGQPLTHYHSLFSELLSWNNPRASGIAYASVISFIIAARYVDVLRYAFKLSYMALGVTVLAEVVGKAVLSKGLASQMRPRKYYTVPRETIDGIFGDIHELVNFFVIEGQRVLFAENLAVSGAVAFAAFLSYYLVKIVPYWGLAVMATTVTFFAPLIYATNQEVIDAQVQKASDIISAQTEQMRSLVNERTEKARGLAKERVGAYTSKAQQMLSGKSGVAEVTPQTAAPSAPLKDADFPEAPKSDIKTEEPTEEEPLIAA